MPKIKIKLSGNSADKIVIAAMKRHITYKKREIKESSPEYKALNIQDWNRQLAAFREVYDYFGGNIK